jgi:hypothetical protein
MTRTKTFARVVTAAAAAATMALGAADAGASTVPGFDASKPVELVNSGTGYRADVWQAANHVNQGLVAWGNNSSLSQEFDLLSSGGGWYRIKARHSGQCLTLDQTAKSWGNGTAVVQNPYCGGDWTANQWRLSFVGAGTSCSGDTCSTTSAVYPILKNRYTGKCLDVNAPDGSPDHGAWLQQWTCISNGDVWNADNQVFNFKNV